MSGLKGMTEWERSLEASRESIAAKLVVMKQFKHTPEGCAEARSFLKDRGVTLHRGLTGWEIVNKANRILKEEL